MSNAQPSPQSPAERRAAEAALRTMIATHAPSHARLIAAARRSLRSHLPTAVEMVYEYRAWLITTFSPSGKGYEGVLALRADSSGVRLYFNRGKDLPDPENLLKGSASLVRFIPLESAATLKRPEVESLIQQAIARNRVAFAPCTASAGALVIQSSLANKTPRRSTKPKSAKPKQTRASPRKSG